MLSDEISKTVMGRRAHFETERDRLAVEIAQAEQQLAGEVEAEAMAITGSAQAIAALKAVDAARSRLPDLRQRQGIVTQVLDRLKGFEITDAANSRALDAAHLRSEYLSALTAFRSALHALLTAAETVINNGRAMDEAVRLCDHARELGGEVPAYPVPWAERQIWHRVAVLTGHLRPTDMSTAAMFLQACDAIGLPAVKGRR